MYKELENQKSQKIPTNFLAESVDEREKNLVEEWKKTALFHDAIRRQGGELFVSYDGPPFATGNPHHGHLLAMSIKDAICRFQALQGKDVITRFGWDCHGVPVEFKVQEMHNVHDHQTILNKGVKWFNDECRKIIFACVDQWYKDTKRLGRAINMDDDYKTMNVSYMESIWKVFSSLKDKGLIYEGKKIVAYSCKLGTPLSDFEAKQNYQEVEDPAITMEFPIVNLKNTFLLVWTTTPWSVPANVAVAINKDIEYLKITRDEKTYILSKKLASNFFDLSVGEIEEVEGESLIGLSYEAPIKCIPKDLEKGKLKNTYTVIHSEHVTDSDGTGCVHICPAYGEDDYILGVKYNLPLVDFIDENGFFEGLRDQNNNIVFSEKTFFKLADSLLIKYLKEQGRLFKNDIIKHQYPYCWRTDTPLMYRAISTWFLAVTKIKDQLLENNEKINWYPKFAGEKRFKNWLVNSRDWAISRNRYWGNPIPVWRNINDPTDIIVLGSKEELERLTGKEFSDLHREFIDEILLERDGKKYKRIEEVFDCWFEAGSMPYGQVHYPFAFKTKEEFLSKDFPADFIAEGMDQTRGWFYVQTVIATALFGKPSFKNVIVNGILLGNDGKKMSKSKGNFLPIDKTFEIYGADATRLFLLGSVATKGREIAVTDNSLKESLKYINYVLNIYKYFADVVNSRKFYELKSDFSGLERLSLTNIDKWFIYRTEKFKSDVKNQFNSYDLELAAMAIKTYIDDWSNWYLHSIKDRIKDDKDDVILALLQYSLDTFSRYSAAIIPFVADNIFRGLYNGKTVHKEILTPLLPNIEQYKAIYNQVEALRIVYHLGLGARNDAGIRLRQPISCIYLPIKLKEIFGREGLQEYEELLRKSLNCEEVIWLSSDKEGLETKIFLNHKIIGPKLRKDAKSVTNHIENGNYTLEGNILSVLDFTLQKDEDFSVQAKPKVNRCYKSEGDIWIIINTELNEELKIKGNLRDLVRNIQQLRKECNLSIVDDQINLYVEGSIIALIEKHRSEIFNKTKIKTLVEEEKDLISMGRKEVKIGNFSGSISLGMNYPSHDKNNRIHIDVIINSLKENNIFTFDALKKIVSLKNPWGPAQLILTLSKERILDKKIFENCCKYEDILNEKDIWSVLVDLGNSKKGKELKDSVEYIFLLCDREASCKKITKFIKNICTQPNYNISNQVLFFKNPIEKRDLSKDEEQEMNKDVMKESLNT